MTIFPRPSEWVRSATGRPENTSRAPHAQHYFAFLSYSHRDEALAKWLHESLEKFRVPSSLVGQLTEHGPVPRRLTPVFRDLGELPASGDLGSEIEEAIVGSLFLIVLCSPAAARSHWIAAEIEQFKRARPEGCILAAIVAGEPFASDTPGREEEECLPLALRYHYDRRGKRTTKRAEPLAADLREPGEARRRGFLKLVAGMLGVGLDDLVQREQLRKQRRLAGTAAGSLVGMLVAGGLAVTAIQARDEARDQRREAESLIGFMLGDLREKLQPIGRLDALDEVGSRVLAYYQKQDASDLPDAALLQRSRALNMMGEVANLRGNSAGALRLYHAALAGTAEALRRQPDDPQRLFDHAQNVFWIGEIARQRGQVREAEASNREYQRLARRMVALEPNNMKWRMETQYADANLGIILYQQRRFDEAARQFQQALQTIEALATADASNAAYQKGLVESLAWLSDAQMSRGQLEQAIAMRQRHVRLLQARISAASGDMDYRQKLIPAHRALGNLYAARGQLDLAIEHMQAAVDEAERLIPLERGNSVWIEFGAKARLNLAELQLLAGQPAQAASHAAAGCRMISGLLGRDRTVAQWRAVQRDCLAVRAEIAREFGWGGRALALAKEALQAAKSVRTGDGVADRYAVAESHRLIGDIHKDAGNGKAALTAWQAAIAVLPSGATPERPAEMGERLILLQRLGQTAEARQLASKLDAIGYRHPKFKST